MSIEAQVVLLHGWATHAGIWQRVESDIEVDTLALDFPGYGALSQQQCPQKLDDLVEHSLARAPVSAIWAGWSLGGIVAMRAAILAPERVKALFLVCSTPKFVNSPDWQWGTDIEMFENFVEGLNQDYKRNLRRFLLLQAGDSRLARQLSKPITEIIGESAQPSATTLLNGLDILRHADLRNQLDQIKVPVFLFSGQLDRICHPEASAWLAEKLAGTLHEIRCGHCPLLSDATEVAQQLSKLVDEVGL